MKNFLPKYVLHLVSGFALLSGSPAYPASPPSTAGDHYAKVLCFAGGAWLSNEAYALDYAYFPLSSAVFPSSQELSSQNPDRFYALHTRCANRANPIPTAPANAYWFQAVVKDTSYFSSECRSLGQACRSTTDCCEGTCDLQRNACTKTNFDGSDTSSSH